MFDSISIRVTANSRYVVSVSPREDDGKYMPALEHVFVEAQEAIDFVSSLVLEGALV